MEEVYFEEKNVEEKTKFDKQKFIKNTLFVFISNIILLISGLVSGFLVPAILPLADYGLFKTFSLYAGYISILQFGLTNGVFLHYGSKNLEDIDPKRFRFISLLLIAIQAICSITTIIVGFALKGAIGGEMGNNYFMICLLLAIYLFAANITAHFQQVSQITQRFKQYSIVLLIQSVLKLVACGLLWVASIAALNKLVSFTFYGFCYVGIFVCLALFYFVSYRKFIFGKVASFSEMKPELKTLFKIGIPLLLADTCVIFVLSGAHQVVSMTHIPDEFAHFAFAYTIISLITTLVSSLSTVLYPTMKRANENELTSNFSYFVSMMLIIGFACLMVYFPIEYVITHFLTKYVESIKILRFIFPGAVITSTIGVLIQNYYKTLKKNLLYFLISLGALALVYGTAFILQITTNDITLIALGNTIVYFVWFIAVQLFFIKKYKAKILKNLIYVALLVFVFVITTNFIQNILLAFVSYAISFALFTFFIYKEQCFMLVKSIFGILLKKNKEKLEIKNDELNNSERLINSRKKSFYILAASLFTLSISLNSCITLLSDDSSAAIAKIVYNQISSEENGFVYASVQPSKYDESMSGYDLNNEFIVFKGYLNKFNSDDLKPYVRVSISAEAKDSLRPLVYLIDGEEIDSQVVSGYNAVFDEQEYGFKVKYGALFEDLPEDLDSLSVYLTEEKAREILLSQDIETTDENIKNLCGQTFDTRTTKYKDGQYQYPKMKILGIIDETSLGELEKVHGKSFTYCQFNTLLYYCGVISYNNYFYGNESAINLMLNEVHKASRKISNVNYEYNFYSVNKDGHYEKGKLQDLVDITNKFYKGDARKTICGLFAAATIVSLVVAFIYSIRFFDILTRQLKLITIITVFAVVFLSIAASKILSLLTIGGATVILDGNIGMILTFVLSIIYSIYILCKKTKSTSELLSSINVNETKKQGSQKRTSNKQVTVKDIDIDYDEISI